MKVKGWDIGLLFLILLVAAIGTRIFYINFLMKDVVISEDVYYHVGIFGLSSVFDDGISLKTVYLAAMDILYIILGDVGSTGVCLNMIFQTFTVVIIFWYIYYATRKYYCFRVSMLIAVFPAYVYKIASVDYYNMVVFLWMVLIIAVIQVNRMISAAFGKKNKNVGGEVGTSMSEMMMAGSVMQQQVKLLENPLPIPKKREHREMDFAIELTPENDDFDIKDLPEGDDFDI